MRDDSCDCFSYMTSQRVRTQFCGYSVKFSPFRENLIAVATSQYYGIAGNGRVSILDLTSQLSPVIEFTTRDCCFDVAWSEGSDSIVAAATGDGSVKIYDISKRGVGDRPLVALTGHSAETYSVDWNIHQKNLIVSASWDRTVKVWDLVSHGAAIRTIPTHTGIVYESKWSPRDSDLFASVGGDGKLVVSSMKTPSPVMTLPGNAELLCVDWNKYRENIIATGGVDRCVRIWDLRHCGSPLHVMDQNLLAVRRVKWSPFVENQLMSCSYDMSVKIWENGGLIQTFNHHSEFAVGIDYSVLRKGLVASTGWDRQVAVWQVGQNEVVHRQKFRQSAA
jgi:peroxin-7